MKGKLLYTLLLLTAALSMSSCRKAIEKAQRNIRFEGIERIERHGLAGIDLTFRMRNDTGYKLVFDEARIDLYYAGSRVGDVTLRERLEVPKHTTLSVASQWKIRISDPLALYLMARKYRAGDLSQVNVSFALKGRGGPAPINISQEKVPVSEFLRIFGLTMDDVKNFLPEQ